MRCTKCNHELDEYGICPNCYNIQDVQTMSNREANHYDGVTIEDENNIHKEQYQQNSHQQSYHQRRYYHSPRNGFKVRYINLGGNSTNWLTRGLIAIGGIAILGFFFFVALPVLLTVLGAGIVAWLIFRFFKRY